MLSMLDGTVRFGERAQPFEEPADGRSEVGPFENQSGPTARSVCSERAQSNEARVRSAATEWNEEKQDVLTKWNVGSW